MTDQQTFVIVGASLTGAKAAEALRDEGFDGRVVLVGEETDRPYERPPLSKDYLRGDEPREKVYVHPEDFYAQHEIELRTATRVTAIEPARAEVLLDGGERMRYDALLLATGAEPRRLQVPGAGLDGILHLRSVDDSDTLRDAIRAASRVVVVGAGWIGSEVAASARQMGADVALVEMAPVPLAQVMGPEVGRVYHDLHAEHGVDLHMEKGVESFVGDGRVRGVRTTDGTVIDGDLVVVGIGVRPRTELAEAAGLAVDDGIVVDEHLATGVDRVFAAGDVANAWHPRFETRLRVEHWANARNQGPAAARAMVRRDVVYDRVPYFFSDQYDLGMEYSGHARDWHRVVFRGEPERREFVAFWLDTDDRVLAGMNANVWDVNDAIQGLVRSREPVDVARLTDRDVPLDELVKAG